MPPHILQPLVTSVTSHRVLLYTLFSLTAVLGVVVNALENHSNFYTTTVYLSKSNRTVVVLANFAFLAIVLLGRLLQHVFFGELRAAEVERLYDRMWFFVTESLLAFTIFRDEFNAVFVMMFGALLFTKCFHWLLSDRIEWMDQRPYPGPPTSFHIRINLLMWLLWVTDFLMFTMAIEDMLVNGVGGIVLFASEYGILLASLLNSTIKYLISMIELRRASQRGGENAPPWEDKSIYVFYVELATDFIKLVTYMTFFMLVLTFYGLPLNIIRDVFVTARSFISRLRDLLRYRRATRNMDELYANATAEEMTAMNDRTCIICREEMVVPSAPSDHPAEQEGQVHDHRSRQQHLDGPNMTPKKLPCGHIFHFFCLRSWLERQQNCPTCRRTVLERNTATQAAGRPGAPPVIGNALRDPQQPEPAQRRVAGNIGGMFNRPENEPAAPVDNDQGIVIQPQPRIFNGFYAPGGEWQNWVDNPPIIPREAPELAPTNDAHAAQSVSTSADLSDTCQNSGEQVPISNPQIPEQRNGEIPNPTDPREAAAAAALRRQGTVAPAIQSAGPSRRSEILSGASSTEGNEVITATRSSGSSTSSGSTVHQASFTHLESNTVTANIGRSRMPFLIPLFDTNLYQPHVPPTSVTSRSPAGISGHGPAGEQTSTTFLPPPTRGFNAVAHPDLYPQAPLPNSATNAWGSQVHRASAAQTGPLPLPTHLSEQQLERMDQLTREAIEERLRVLESVQRISHRCINELLRVRSVLPSSSGSHIRTDSTSSSSKQPMNTTKPTSVLIQDFDQVSGERERNSLLFSTSSSHADAAKLESGRLEASTQTEDFNTTRDHDPE